MVAEENKPTIKPITIKPIKITPIKPATGANPAQSISINPNPQQASADSSLGSPTIRLKPVTNASIPTPNAAPAAAPAIKPINVTPATAPTIKPINVAPAATPEIKPVSASPINLKAPAQAPITSKAPTTSMPKVVPSADDDGKATMRIRPPAPAAAPAIKLSPVTPPVGDITAQASKGKTSRISLDSAMDNASASGNSPAPVGKLTSHIPDIASSAPKSSTVKINVPPEEINTQQVTRKRTLRVKAPARTIPQPGAAPVATDSEAKTVVRKPLSIKKPGTPVATPVDTPVDVANNSEGGISHIPGIEDESIMAFGGNKAPVKAVKVNPLFIVVSSLSIVAILIIIVMFLAQSSGPDRSLTKYSSMPDSSEFGFPGKIPRG